jgi:tRNA nucleotidyltransferase (CCA-adding enzyme)
MKKYLDKLPADVRLLIESSGTLAHSKGYAAYLVGGFVRDMILGVRNFDVDIVVEGDGIGFAHDLAHSLQGKLVAHHRFGTATIVLKNHMKVDIASARKESYPYPAHLPVVQPGTLRDDLFRRDFTINALALQITHPGYGNLIDFFGGKKDLVHGVLRVLHPVSFIDDPTRILRGIRFEQRFDFSFEPYTAKLLRAASKQSMIGLVEPQRIRDELILMLKEPHPVKGIRRTAALIGFSFISSKLCWSRRMMRTLTAIERRVEWFRRQTKVTRPLEEWLAFFMGLVATLSVSDVHAVCRRFVFRKGEEKRIVSCIESCAHALTALERKTLKRSDVYHILEPLSYEVIVVMLSFTDSVIVVKRIEEFLGVSHGIRTAVSGHDLDACGLKPGPQYQHILRMVLNAKLDGKIKDKACELRYARKMIKKLINRKEP